MELWERQKGEGSKAFAAFAAYRDMGPMDRSQAKVHEVTGSDRRTIERWSSQYEWTKRVEAWDLKVDRERCKKNLEKLEAMNDEHAVLGKSLLVKAAKALTRIPEDEIKASDIVRMIEVGAKLERISRGAASEIVEERDGGKAMNPVQFYMPDNLRESEGDRHE